MDDCQTAEEKMLRLPPCGGDLSKIPKRKTMAKGVLQSPDPHEEQRLAVSITASFLLPSSEKKWQLVSIKTIHNPKLLDKYREKKVEMKEERRSKWDPSTTLTFTTSTDGGRVARLGVSIDKTQKSVLGNSKMGVHLYRHGDLCLLATNPCLGQKVEMMVCKVMMGRSKSVTVGGGGSVMDPTPNYHSHHSSLTPDPTDNIGLAQKKSQVYIYEYDDEGLPSQYPRHCLPLGIVTYIYTPQASSKDSYNSTAHLQRAPLCTDNTNSSYGNLYNHDNFDHASAVGHKHPSHEPPRQLMSPAKIAATGNANHGPGQWLTPQKLDLGEVKGHGPDGIDIFATGPYLGNQGSGQVFPWTPQVPSLFSPHCQPLPLMISPWQIVSPMRSGSSQIMAPLGPSPPPPSQPNASRGSSQMMAPLGPSPPQPSQPNACRGSGQMMAPLGPSPPQPSQPNACRGSGQMMVPIGPSPPQPSQPNASRESSLNGQANNLLGSNLVGMLGSFMTNLQQVLGHQQRADPLSQGGPLGQTNAPDPAAHHHTLDTADTEHGDSRDNQSESYEPFIPGLDLVNHCGAGNNKARSEGDVNNNQVVGRSVNQTVVTSGVLVNTSPCWTKSPVSTADCKSLAIPGYKEFGSKEPSASGKNTTYNKVLGQTPGSSTPTGVNARQTTGTAVYSASKKLFPAINKSERITSPICTTTSKQSISPVGGAVYGSASTKLYTTKGIPNPVPNGIGLVHKVGGGVKPLVPPYYLKTGTVSPTQQSSAGVHRIPHPLQRGRVAPDKQGFVGLQGRPHPSEIGQVCAGKRTGPAERVFNPGSTKPLSNPLPTVQLEGSTGARGPMAFTHIMPPEGLSQDNPSWVTGKPPAPRPHPIQIGRVSQGNCSMPAGRTFTPGYSPVLAHPLPTENVSTWKMTRPAGRIMIPGCSSPIRSLLPGPSATKFVSPGFSSTRNLSRGPLFTNSRSLGPSPRENLSLGPSATVNPLAGFSPTHCLPPGFTPTKNLSPGSSPTANMWQGRRELEQTNTLSQDVCTDLSHSSQTQEFSPSKRTRLQKESSSPETSVEHASSPEMFSLSKRTRLQKESSNPETSVEHAYLPEMFSASKRTKLQKESSSSEMSVELPSSPTMLSATKRTRLQKTIAERGEGHRTSPKEPSPMKRTRLHKKSTAERGEGHLSPPKKPSPMKRTRLHKKSTAERGEGHPSPPEESSPMKRTRPRKKVTTPKSTMGLGRPFPHEELSPARRTSPQKKLCSLDTSEHSFLSGVLSPCKGRPPARPSQKTNNVMSLTHLDDPVALSPSVQADNDPKSKRIGGQRKLTTAVNYRRSKTGGESTRLTHTMLLEGSTTAKSPEEHTHRMQLDGSTPNIDLMSHLRSPEGISVDNPSQETSKPPVPGDQLSDTGGMAVGKSSQITSEPPGDRLTGTVLSLKTKTLRDKNILETFYSQLYSMQKDLPRTQDDSSRRKASPKEHGLKRGKKPGLEYIYSEEDGGPNGRDCGSESDGDSRGCGTKDDLCQRSRDWDTEDCDSEEGEGLNSRDCDIVWDEAPKIRDCDIEEGEDSNSRDSDKEWDGSQTSSDSGQEEIDTTAYTMDFCEHYIEQPLTASIPNPPSPPGVRSASFTSGSHSCLPVSPGGARAVFEGPLSPHTNQNKGSNAGLDVCFSPQSVQETGSSHMITYPSDPLHAKEVGLRIGFAGDNWTMKPVNRPEKVPCYGQSPTTSQSLSNLFSVGITRPNSDPTISHSLVPKGGSTVPNGGPAISQSLAPMGGSTAADSSPAMFSGIRQASRCGSTVPNGGPAISQSLAPMGGSTVAYSSPAMFSGIRQPSRGCSKGPSPSKAPPSPRKLLQTRFKKLARGTTHQSGLYNKDHRQGLATSSGKQPASWTQSPQQPLSRIPGRYCRRYEFPGQAKTITSFKGINNRKNTKDISGGINKTNTRNQNTHNTPTNNPLMTTQKQNGDTLNQKKHVSGSRKNFPRGPHCSIKANIKLLEERITRNLQIRQFKVFQQQLNSSDFLPAAFHNNEGSFFSPDSGPRQQTSTPLPEWEELGDSLLQLREVTTEFKGNQSEARGVATKTTTNQSQALETRAVTFTGQSLALAGDPVAISTQSKTMGGAAVAIIGQLQTRGGASVANPGQSQTSGGDSVPTNGQLQTREGAPVASGDQSQTRGGAPLAMTGQSQIRGGAPVAITAQSMTRGGASVAVPGQSQTRRGPRTVSDQYRSLYTILEHRASHPGDESEEEPETRDMEDRNNQSESSHSQEVSDYTPSLSSNSIVVRGTTTSLPSNSQVVSGTTTSLPSNRQIVSGNTTSRGSYDHVFSGTTTHSSKGPDIGNTSSPSSKVQVTMSNTSSHCARKLQSLAVPKEKQLMWVPRSVRNACCIPLGKWGKGNTGLKGSNEVKAGKGVKDSTRVKANTGLKGSHEVKAGKGVKDSTEIKATTEVQDSAEIKYPKNKDGGHIKGSRSVSCLPMTHPEVDCFPFHLAAGRKRAGNQAFQSGVVVRKSVRVHVSQMKGRINVSTHQDYVQEYVGEREQANMAASAHELSRNNPTTDNPMSSGDNNATRRNTASRDPTRRGVLEQSQTLEGDSASLYDLEDCTDLYHELNFPADPSNIDLQEDTKQDPVYGNTHSEAVSDSGQSDTTAQAKRNHRRQSSSLGGAIRYLIQPQEGVSHQGKADNRDGTTVIRPNIGGPNRDILDGPAIGGPKIGGTAVGGPAVGGPRIGGPKIGGRALSGSGAGGSRGFTYTKYCYPPVRVRIPGPSGATSGTLSEDVFEQLDDKVCQMYKDFTSRVLKALQTARETNMADPIMFPYITSKLRRLEAGIAHIHIDIECYVTFYETQTIGAPRRLSQWQRRHLLGVKEHLEVLERTVQAKGIMGGDETETQMERLLEKRRQILREILIPRLPRESPGNTLEYLTPILQDTKRIAKRVFLQKKINALRQVEMSEMADLIEQDRIQLAGLIGVYDTQPGHHDNLAYCHDNTPGNQAAQLNTRDNQPSDQSNKGGNQRGNRQHDRRPSNHGNRELDLDTQLEISLRDVFGEEDCAIYGLRGVETGKEESDLTEQNCTQLAYL